MIRFTVHLICTVLPLPLEVGVLILTPVEPEALRPNAFLLLLETMLHPVDARRGEGKCLMSVLRMGDVGRGMAWYGKTGEENVPRNDTNEDKKKKVSKKKQIKEKEN